MHRKAQLVVTPQGQIEAERAREEQDAATIRHDIRSGGILVIAALAVIYAVYLGREFLLPLALAVVVNLLLRPAMRLLQERLRFPGPLAALLLIIAVLGAIATVAVTISVPASGWIEKAPHSLPLLKEKISILRQPFDYIGYWLGQLENIAGSTSGDGAVGQTVTVKQSTGLASYLATGTTTTLSRFFITMVMLFFLLVSGDRLLRGFVEVLPRFKDKRTAVEIANETVDNISGYLLTITMMNTVVGVATAIAMQLCGLGDPLLWGVLAFLLNYVPVLGPMTGVVIFFVAGLVSFDRPWYALIPAGIYLLIHIAEGETITPMLLARRFTLNPVLVIVSLFFWHTLWGIPGALLAVPLLAIFKIIADRINPLKPIGHVIGS
jgi:predicted PurR-regulated permease PerM